MKFSVHEFVEASLYPDEDAVVQEALRHLLQAHPEMRLQLALCRYQKGEMTFEEAAKMAGISLGHMRNMLVERGIPLRLNAQSFLAHKKAFEKLRMKDEFTA